LTIRAPGTLSKWKKNGMPDFLQNGAQTFFAPPLDNIVIYAHSDGMGIIEQNRRFTL
jgi:hypothetical protein